MASFIRSELVTEMVGLLEDIAMSHADERESLIEQLFSKCSSATLTYPDDPYAHLHLAHALELKGEYAEAIKINKKALRLAPRDEYCHQQLGALYLHSERDEEAVECFKESLQIIRRFPWAYNGLGAAYLNLGRFSRAAGSFKVAIKIYEAAVRMDRVEVWCGDTFIPPFAYLGEAYSKSGKTDLAKENYAKALQFAGNKDEMTFDDYITAIRAERGLKKLEPAFIGKFENEALEKGIFTEQELKRFFG